MNKSRRSSSDALIAERGDTERGRSSLRSTLDFSPPLAPLRRLFCPSGRQRISSRTMREESEADGEGCRGVRRNVHFPSHGFLRHTVPPAPPGPFRGLFVHARLYRSQRVGPCRDTSGGVKWPPLHNRQTTVSPAGRFQSSVGFCGGFRGLHVKDQPGDAERQRGKSGGKRKLQDVGEPGGW